MRIFSIANPQNPTAIFTQIHTRKSNAKHKPKHKYSGTKREREREYPYASKQIASKQNLKLLISPKTPTFLSHIAYASTSPNITLFLIFYIFFFCANALFPAQSDDLGAHIGTVESIIHSYLHWNARLGELLRVWFGSYLASTPYFAFINPLFCVGLLYLLFGRTPRLFVAQNLSQQPSQTKGTIDFSDLAILCFILLVFMLNRGFGAIFFWAAGSLNYLWAYCLILAFCLPYRMLLAKSFAPQTKKSTTQTDTQTISQTNTHKPSPQTNLQTNLQTTHTKENLKSCAMLILAILSGLGSEFSIVLIIFAATLFAFAFYKEVKLPIWAYFGIVGLSIGFCALYFSPGHAHRAEVVKNLYGGYASLSEIWTMSVGQKYARFASIFSEKMLLLPLIATLGVIIFIVFRHFVNAFVGALLLVYVVCICVKWGSFGSLGFLLLPSAVLLCVFAYRTSQEKLKRYFLILAGLFLAYFITASATIQVALPNRAKIIFTIIWYSTADYFSSHLRAIYASKVKNHLAESNMWDLCFVRAICAIC